MKVFKEDNKATKEVAVVLKESYLYAVDSVTGVNLARLFSFGNMRPPVYAEPALKCQGYRTDFAEWNEDGSMSKMLEDFE